MNDRYTVKIKTDGVDGRVSLGIEALMEMLLLKTRLGKEEKFESRLAQDLISFYKEEFAESLLSNKMGAIMIFLFSLGYHCAMLDVKKQISPSVSE